MFSMSFTPALRPDWHLRTPATLTLTCVMALGLATAAHAQTTVVNNQHTQMEEFAVIGHLPVNPTLSTTIPKNANGLPAADGGDFLKSLPAVHGSRMSGHGIDPVIRGQSRGQLNIIANGAFSFNAGPNRMDPPTAFADIQTTDLVIVQRGYQSVQHGPGGSGGTVIFEHQPPVFADNTALKANTNAGYESNGNIWSLSSDIAAKLGQGYLRATGHFKDADNYEDGSGTPVRTAFRHVGGGVEGGLNNDSRRLVMGLEYDRVDDTLFAGAAMDSPLSTRLTLRARADHDFDNAALLQALHLNLYISDVDHIMDNYSLRDRDMMFRRSDMESLSYGGKLVADLTHGQTQFNLGVDLQHRQMDGLRSGNNMTSDLNSFFIQSVLIPDTHIDQIGLFMEGITPLADNLSLKAGLRYDHLTARLKKADLATTMMTLRPANALYQKYYGTTTTDQTEHNLSGLLRAEYALDQSSTAYLGISRSVRSADATERAVASDMGNAPMMNMSWIGNPNLSPEKHYQIDLGYGIRHSRWTLLLSAYLDQVDDYILRDTARGQSGILVADGASIYRNIDARLWGVELDGSLQLTPKISLAADAAYTYGQNTDLDTALPQIPPLSGKASLTYQARQWALGGRLRWATTQTRVDADPALGSGRDTGKTPGYAVVDVFGNLTPTDSMTLRFGAANLLDKNYADHLNRENLDDGSAVQVNEPGRSLYLKLQLSL